MNITNSLSLSQLPVQKNLESNMWILWGNIVNPEANAKPATGNVHSRAAVGIGIHLEPVAQLVPSFPGTALYLLFTPLSAQGYSHQGYLFCLEAGALTLEQHSPWLSLLPFSYRERRSVITAAPRMLLFSLYSAFQGSLAERQEFAVLSHFPFCFKKGSGQNL